MKFKLAWRNIWRNKRRSLIAIASITFAVFFSCLMMSTQLGTYSRMIDNSVRFYTGYIQIMDTAYWDEKTIDNSILLSPGLLQEIAQTPGILAVAPRIETFALASSTDKTKGALVIGIDPEQEDQLTRAKRRLIEGEFLSKNDNQVVIGQGLAQYFELEVGDTLVLISRGYHGSNAAGKYRVKGIMRIPVPEMNNQLIYLPLEEAQWFLDANGLATSIALLVDDPDNVDAILEHLTSNLDAGEISIMGWREMMPELVQAIEFDYVSGIVMMFVLYAVIGFGIFGTFLMMTNERMYEFGILLSIGMKRNLLQQVLMAEVLTVGLLGSLAGILISFPIIYYLYRNPIYLSGGYEQIYEQFGFEPVISFAADAMIFYRQAIIVLAMSLLIGLYPIFKISKVDPVRAIRQ